MNSRSMRRGLPQLRMASRWNVTQYAEKEDCDEFRSFPMHDLYLPYA